MRKVETPTVEIQIQPGVAGQWPIVFERRRIGEDLARRISGMLTLAWEELERAESSREYGTILGKALFQHDVAKAFGEALASSGGRLRVLLSVEARDLRVLRWNLLCAPLEAPANEGWDFLALDQRMLFSLFMPGHSSRRFRFIGRDDLHMLILAASPQNLDAYQLTSFNPHTMITGLKSVFPADHCFLLEPASLNALAEQITDGPYTLLHIVCHGKFDPETGETVLFFAADNGQVELVAGETLLEWLSRLQGMYGPPHLIFLCACDTAAPEAEAKLGSLAQRLVRELGVPAVIAMTGSISVLTAQKLAEAFYPRLLAHGEVDRALVEACAGTLGRYDIGVPTLFSRLENRPLFDEVVEQLPNKRLSDRDIRYGLNRMSSEMQRRAPSLYRAFEDAASRLRDVSQPDRAAVSVQLNSANKGKLGTIEEICEEVFEMSFSAMALDEPLLPYNDRLPFRGLEHFRYDDKDFFKAREPQVRTLLKRLDSDPNNRFLAILGPSGCGKSSLVLAGMIPALEQQEPGLCWASLRPGDDLLARLEASLKALPTSGSLLVIDQFEELFALCKNEETRQTFFERLLPLANEMRVILTMRADYWGECAPYGALREAMQAHQQLIAPMTSQELWQAMEEQSAEVGLRFQADLPSMILEDVQGEPGAMPLLQHALLELWNRRHGRWLRVDEYRDLGRVRQAIAHTADQVYDALSPDDQVRMRDIFLRLTRLDDSRLGGELRDTRQRVTLPEFLLDDGNRQAIESLLDRLADARLIVKGLDAETNKTEVEVAHEALIRHWPRLREWLAEDRTAVLLREGVRRGAEEWDENGRDESYLTHRGKRLDDASVLLAHPRLPLNDLERTYLLACREIDLQGRKVLVDVMIVKRLAGRDSSTIDVHLLRRGAAEDTMADEMLLTRGQVELDLVALRYRELDGIAYGQLLSDYFGADSAILAALTQVSEPTDDPSEQIALRLLIDPAATELHAIAWESLLNPTDGTPLLVGERLRVIRAISSDEASLHSRDVLRTAVVFVSSVSDRVDGPREPHEAMTELEQKRAVFENIGIRAATFTHRGGAVADYSWLPTEEYYDILYLIGTVSMSGGDVWLGSNDPEREDAISSRTLSKILHDRPRRPRLVIVQAFAADGGASPARRGSREALEALAVALVQAGVPAVLTLPAAMTRETVETTVATVMAQVQQHGMMDRALAIARYQLRERSDWWQPTLYTCVEHGRIWYIPGFENNLEDSSRWAMVLKMVQAQHCVPILGPGLLDLVVGPQRLLARRWAEKYGMPRAMRRRGDLAEVAQYLRAKQGWDFPYSELLHYFAQQLRKQLAGDWHDSSLFPKVDGVMELMKLVNDKHRQMIPDDPYVLLAALPLPVYITTNPDNLLASALHEANRHPEVVLCPWNEYMEEPASIYDREPDYRPTPERPLVYHLFGHIKVPESVVLTEDDYARWFSFVIRERTRIPPLILSALSSRMLIYLGFHSNDRSFETIFRWITGRSDAVRRRRYVHVMQDEIEGALLLDWERGRYDRKDWASIEYIQIYWGSMEDFVRDLRRHRDAEERPVTTIEQQMANPNPTGERSGQATGLSAMLDKLQDMLHTETDRSRKTSAMLSHVSFSTNPFVGPRPIMTGEVLYGRDREVEELFSLLVAERIVLFYAPSGAGKTSLIQAGLIPRLQHEGFHVLPVVVRVSLTPSAAVSDGQPFNRYIVSLLLSLEAMLPSEQRRAFDELVTIDLPTYLMQHAGADDEQRVLIFDQFEEILTDQPLAYAEKQVFFKQLAVSLRDPHWTVLFAMREDRLAALDSYRREIPTQLRTTFRMNLLEQRAAFEVLTGQARSAGLIFTDNAA